MSLAHGPCGDTGGSYQFHPSGDTGCETKILLEGNGISEVKDSITILCWVYLSNNSTRGCLLRYGRNDRKFVCMGVADGKLYYAMKTKMEKVVKGHKELTSQQWYYVGASFNHTNREVNLWVDGIKMKNTSVFNSVKEHEWRCGEGPKVKFGAALNGRIAAMQVYNLSLNKEQINAVKYAHRMNGKDSTILHVRTS